MADVLVDVFEGESRITEHVRARGIRASERSLAVGDYVIGDALVERKTTRDLGSSIVRGRFWPQIGRLRKAARRCYLLVEGLDLEETRLRPTSTRGALLTVAELGIDLVRSVDPADSAMWLAVLTRHPSRSAGKRRPWYAQQPSHADVSEAMLAAVPGVALRGASALLARFGSVRGVVNATEEEWLEVPGIGPKRAAALAHAIAHRIQPS